MHVREMDSRRRRDGENQAVKYQTCLTEGETMLLHSYFFFFFFAPFVLRAHKRTHAMILLVCMSVSVSVCASERRVALLTNSQGEVLI